MAATEYQFAVWGSQGSGQGQFNLPQGIAVSITGYVYVSDTKNDRIQKFTSTGTPVKTWGTYGSGNGQFNWPLGIAVDGAGNVYVVDSGNKRIQKFDANGGYITQWGSGVSANFVGIAVSSDGYVYVTNNVWPHQEIMRYRSDGTGATAMNIYWYQEFGTYYTGDSSGITVDGAGAIYEINCVPQCQVVKYDSFGDTSPLFWGNSVSDPNNDLVHPEDIAIDSAGSIYICDSAHIHKFSQSGTSLTEIAEIGGLGYGLGRFQYPRAIDVDSAGTIYIADTNNNRVQRIVPVIPTTPPTPTPAPTAAFTAAPISGTAPLSVQFTDTSTNSPTSWSWTFGDSATSTLHNPIHTYTAAGTYAVTLRATNGGGYDDETKLGYITVAAPPPAVKPITGGTGVPGDTNADGKFDDVNGNSRKDFADVVLYFNQMTWIGGNEPVGLFDFNGNGRIDFADVVWLFNHL